MVTEAALRGYLLEEVLAWLLRSSGYDLLSAADEDEKVPERQVLAQRYNGLAVRGRGAWHQADALAHQISLVDLSMPDFEGLRTLVSSEAKLAHQALSTLSAGSRPRVYHVRSYLRQPLLQVVGDDIPLGEDLLTLPLSVAEPLDRLAERLSSRSTLGLVLAFPSAPFVVGLASENLYGFVNYAREHPTHTVHLRRLPQAASHPVWQLRPAEDPSAYAMTFSLPEQVESWILAQDESIASRTRWIKRSVLSTMTIYWLDGDHALTFQLRYAPAELREQTG
ncbi:hypothetical protein [Streptomyces rugosispiralis]|uniref:Uncharacterized protein n=1 Tax=Streptomyces rugosispiralis TaxID=2967341 RepID=A0ABT1V0V6_9ACTN|nr:hypothetical protein [Streptomyces rugosispiralis]MCQ8191014.1 hypothetical protein [Streptomyces rugosispiralis]